MNLAVLLWVLLAAIAFHIVMHFVDKNRIKDEVETKLGRVVSITWNPFGRGWFFEKNERHYEVTYINRCRFANVTNRNLANEIRHANRHDR